MELKSLEADAYFHTSAIKMHAGRLILGDHALHEPTNLGELNGSDVSATGA